MWARFRGCASSVYFSTGNGPFGPPNYGDSVLKLSFGLQLLSYFSPADQAYNLVHDIDLGSGGVLVLPDQPDSPLPLLTMCGKDGKIFLLSRDSLGGYTGPAGNNTNAVQTLPLQPGRQESPNSDENPGVWGGPAYWNGPNGQFLYYCGNGGPLTAFVLQNGELSPAMLPNGEPNQSRMNFPALGGSTPIVSSNQQVPGTAVVWAIARRDDNSQIHLWAFDAANLTNRLVALPAGEWNNPMGNAFIEPTVADGKVFVASSGALTVFGLF